MTSLGDSTKSDISITDIENIDDFSDAFEFADKLDIDLTGLDELIEMQERLSMEVDKAQPGFINSKVKISKQMHDYNRDDVKKREKLLELLVEIQSKLTRSDGDFCKAVSIIDETLRTEGISDNLSADLQERRQYLQNGECCFVVAGETSAGKSLFLNLLLDVDILPYRLESCTSVITKLSYGEKQTAKIIYQDKARKDVIYENVQPEDIKNLLFEANLEKREKTSDIKEIQIQLPAKLLKSGLVLVDSPGVGENDEMDKVIEQFVDENRVMGFIYVIKSNNGGGVDEDRLIRLIRIILQKESTKGDKGSFRFHPGCAMFVCNIWDQVTEPEKVYQYIVGRLGKIWPHFDEKKVVRFSTQNAKREVDCDVDYITSNYRSVLRLIDTIYAKALDDRIKRTYRWISSILQRTVHHLKIIARQLHYADGRLDTEIQDADRKLEKLKNDSSKVVADLRDQIKSTSKELCVKFREHLRSPVVRMCITQWIEPELPNVYKEDTSEEKKDWISLKSEIDSRITDRIAKELDKWEEENGIIAALEDTLVKIIHTQLFGFKNDVKNIEQQLDSSTSSRGSCDSQKGKSRRESVCAIFYEQRNIDKDMFELSTIARNKIFQPLQNILNKFKPGNNKLITYEKDKTGYASKRATKILKRFTDPCVNEEDQMLIVMESFMESAKTKLDKLILEIPSLINANQNIIRRVVECRHESALSRRVYEALMVDLEILKHLLADYGAGYILVEDFRPNELHMLDPTDNDGHSTIPFKISQLLESMSNSQRGIIFHQPIRSLWTAHQKGLLKTEEEEDVFIKIYLPSCKMQNCFKEVSKLRLLDHKNLASFLGIQHSDSTHPALVYKDHLQPLRYYINKYGSIDIPMALKEILCGLEYLHKHGMVHMELNTNTVMVSRNGTVRLTGGCLPRTADIPENSEQHVLGDFLFLSPEVLRGDLYISCADVYAFGLLLLEIMFGFDIFRKQSRMCLDTFIHTYDSNFVEKFQGYMNDMQEDSKHFIYSCLDNSEGSRPMVSKLLEDLPYLKFDTIESEHKYTPTTRHSMEASRL